MQLRGTMRVTLMFRVQGSGFGNSFVVLVLDRCYHQYVVFAAAIVLNLMIMIITSLVVSIIVANSFMHFNRYH